MRIVDGRSKPVSAGVAQIVYLANSQQTTYAEAAELMAVVRYIGHLERLVAEKAPVRLVDRLRAWWNA